MPKSSKYSRDTFIGRPRRPSTITVPKGAGPHVKLLFAEMRRLNITYDDVEEGSGVRRAALKAWRHKNRPNLDSIEAALGFVGWDFVPVPRAKALPPEVDRELREVAARLDLTMPQTVQYLVEIVAGIHGRFGDVPRPVAMREAEEPGKSSFFVAQGDPIGPVTTTTTGHRH